jgi:GT2 family glycosyltransferase
MMRPPFVSTIILNTNRKEDTLAALTSLAACDYPNNHCIVLDNASMDGSVEAIRSCFPDVEVIELSQNLGYAGNNNVGIRAALDQGADWIFVLNEDTVLASDCITRLIEAGESDPRIGIVGPMVYHFDEPDVIQSAGGRMDRDWRVWHLAQNELDQGQFTAPHAVEWISGCAIMVRRAVIEQIGGLDERFFYYWEETEWCLRARENGWTIVHIPKAKLWHKGVQRNYQPGPNITYYSTRNRFLMLSKHQAPLTAWMVAWGQTFRTLVSWSVKPKWAAMRSHRIAMWQGARDFVNHRWGMRVSE